MRTFILCAAVGVVAASSAAGQAVTANGQLRPRYEFRDPVSGGRDAFVSMRSRADLNATLSERVRAMVQVQDVRLWGEEGGTLSDYSADNLDLHQGFVDLLFSGKDDTFVRVGRQELSLGGERLVGAVDWTQQGRSFDGVRVRKRFSRATVDLFGFALSDSPGSGAAFDAQFSGVYLALNPASDLTVDVFGFYHEVDAANPTNQTTLGLRGHGTLQDRVEFRLEGAYQLGERSGSDVAAFMLGARVGTAVADGAGSVAFWWDYLSGDDDPTDADNRVFDTLFATNHKFYGLADLFLDIPAHTGGLGLQDLAAKGAYRPRDDLSVNLDVHTFRLAKTGMLSSGHLGEEADLGLTYRYEPGVTFNGGLSHVFSGSALNALGRLTEDMTYVYLALNTVF